MKKYYLAIDIGASSGRHIVGRREGTEIKTDEVFQTACAKKTDIWFGILPHCLKT